MSPVNAEPHIATLLDSSAAGQAGMTIYARGQRPLPTRLSYRELLNLATEKADMLRRYKDIVPGRIVLIHFSTHVENITWLWASILAGCIPTISTPLVSNSKGRISHFKHLHHLLFDPIVITSRELISRDFIDNDILRVAAIEEIERCSCSKPPTGKNDFKNLTGLVPGDQLHRLDFGPHDRYDSLSDGTAIVSVNEPISCMSSDYNYLQLNVEGNSSTSTSPMIYEASHTHSTILNLEGVAVLMLTSGSTGNAKAVCLTHKQLFAAMSGKLANMPSPKETSLLNWIALDHVASLVEIHLCAMFAGLDQIHVSAVEVLENPLMLLRLASEHRVSRTFAPNFFLHRLQAALNEMSTQDIQSINLRDLLYIASGGEPNNVKVCTEVTKHLLKLGALKENIITPGFGMTETCAGAIFNHNCPRVDIQANREFAALGKCIPGIEMRVIPIDHTTPNADDTSDSTGLEGALEIRGPVIFERYFNDEEATRNAFTPDGWFKTGDIATIDTDGNLKLIGRSKELIVINGVKYLPHEIEEIIDQAEIIGITKSFIACFGFHSTASSPEEICVVYQHTFDANDCEARTETLRYIVRSVVLFTGTRPRVLPVAPGRLSKTTLGKLLRSKILASLHRGDYKEEEELDARMLQVYSKAHYSEPRDSVEHTLVAIVCDVLRFDSLERGIDTPILDLGVTSVDLIRLKGRCEKAFNIAEIPIITIMTNTTIRSLASAIERSQIPQDKDDYNPVVTLQENGSKTPMWLIHPGIGEVLVFLGLAQYFPDRPVHALRSRGFNPGEQPFNDLGDVVATYYRALKLRQPNGPYAIAGYSYGSMLAFEISKILERNGDTVLFLGSFNLPPYIKERMRMLDWTAGLLHIAHFCGVITEQKSEVLVEELHELQHPEQVAKLLAGSDQQRCTELALTPESLLNWTDVAWSLQKIGWEYEPSGSVAHIDVFYCQPLKIVARTREEYRVTRLSRWAEFVREDVSFHEVDGEHYTMIGPDNVHKFQQTLRRVLARRGL